MIHVCICDDEIEITTELERVLFNIFEKLNIEHEIDVFSSSEKLYQKMETGTHYDLIFLDIEFTSDTINGVEVGQLIRDVHSNHLVSIVYISWKKNYALQLFDIQPLNFLIKPLAYEKVEEVVRRYLKIAGLMSGTLTYKKGRDTFKVPIRDIIYLENYERKVIIHLSDGGTEEFYGSLKEIYEEDLKRFDFLFIHASYAVNYDYVTTLQFDQVFLLGREESLPISKHRAIEVRGHFFEIVKRRKG